MDLLNIFFNLHQIMYSFGKQREKIWGEGHFKENVTKTYKKSNDKLVGELDSKSAKIAEPLKLDDRVEKLATNEAFVTLKDHKPNFSDHPTCRLINPSKSEIGVISKLILDDINASIISSTKINQWKNTASVLKWFNSLKNVFEKWHKWPFCRAYSKAK